MWDDTDNDMVNATIGTGLSYTHSTHTLASTAGGAPSTATYITQTADGTLSAEQALGSLATGILKNTTTTGVLSIAAAGDFPTLNQSTTGSAATLTTARNLWGQSFDGSAAVGGAIELGTSGTTDTTLDRSSAGVASIEGVKVLATNSTSGTQQGLLAVNASSGAVVGTQARAAGTATSGTAGTNVATITAGAGNQFVCINGFVSQANATSTAYLVTITYSDSTTTSYTSGTATGSTSYINDASIASINAANITAHSTKKITSVAVTTSGTGTGQRQASLSAVEIPQ
jgi:hypothetical protein